MTKFYFVRHGDPDWCLNDGIGLRGHGRDLVPLTDKGILQAKNVSRDERIRKSQIIVSSPYTRALQTAAIISKETGIDLVVEMDLREWQPDLTFQYDSESALNELYNDYVLHNGIYPENEKKLWEAFDSMQKRIEYVIEKYLDYSHVTLVAHGMILKSVCGAEKIDHCGVVEYEK